MKTEYIGGIVLILVAALLIYIMHLSSSKNQDDKVFSFLGCLTPLFLIGGVILLAPVILKIELVLAK